MTTHTFQDVLNWVLGDLYQYEKNYPGNARSYHPEIAQKQGFPLSEIINAVETLKNRGLAKVASKGIDVILCQITGEGLLHWEKHRAA